jgi:hypothetical protein
MRRFLLICVSLIIACHILAPQALAEEYVVRGTLTIKADNCKELPNLAGTRWTGKVESVSALGYQSDENFKVTINTQKGHLFEGDITAFGLYVPSEEWVDVPIYGALTGCYQIKISTGQTVLHADLNEAADFISGYYFSTDPLDGPPFDKLDPNPHMATFELSLDEEILLPLD